MQQQMTEIIDGNWVTNYIDFGPVDISEQENLHRQIIDFENKY